MKLGSSSDQTIKPYFYTASPLVLLPTLLDVSQDAKKQSTAESLMTPIAVTIPIPSVLKDSHFTKKLFTDPVITAAGDTYEREQIETWLKDHDTNPWDNERLEDKTLRPNKTKLREVNEFLEQNLGLRDSEELYLPRSWVRELEQACIEGKLEVIKQRCDRDPRLGSWTFSFEEKEYAAYRGKTVLHLACTKGTLAAVDHLLALEEKRAEGLGLLLLLKKDSTGKLPIHYTMTPDRDPQMMCQLAIQMGKHLADVMPIDLPTMPGEKQRQMTALHLAAMNNDVEIITTLLRSKVDLTVKDSEGNTALHAAVACGAREAITLLIKAGASSEIKNDAGQTAEQVGLACGQETAASTLRHCVVALAQQQQAQLQQSGTVGIALLQMQQTMEQLQSLVKAQAVEIKELRATIAEQGEIITHRHAEQIAQLEQKESEEALMLHAELRGQRAAIQFVKQQIKEVAGYTRGNKVWEPVPFVKTPAELRKVLTTALLTNPFVQDIKMILHDVKESKLELKRTAIPLGDGIYDISRLAGSLPDGRLIVERHDLLMIIDVIRNERILLPGQIRRTTDSSDLDNFRIYTIAKGQVVKRVGDSVQMWDIDQKAYQELKCAAAPSDYHIGAICVFPGGRLLERYWKPKKHGMPYCDSKIDIIDITDHSRTNFIELQSNFFQHLVISPDAQFLLTDFNDSLAVFEIASGKHRVTLAESEMKNVNSPISNMISFKYLTITFDGYVIGYMHHKLGQTEKHYLKIWDAVKGICLFTITLKDQLINLIALPNGYIMSFDANSIKVWDVTKGFCMTSYEDVDKFSSARGTNVTLLNDGRVLLYYSGLLYIYNHVGGQSIDLNLRFRASLLEADSQWIADVDHLQISTHLPCGSSLKELADIVQVVCSDHPPTIAVTSTSLTITGLSTELRADLENLCQALSIPKAAPTTAQTQAMVSGLGLTSLLTRPGGLYAPLSVLSSVVTDSVATGTSSSSSASFSAGSSGSSISTAL